MRRSIKLAIVLALASLVGAAEAADVPTGTWKITVTYGSRARDSILKLETEGNRLTGFMFHHLGHRSELANVRFDGEKLSFTVDDRRAGSATQYTATVGPEKMQGQTTYRRRGETRTVDWEAKRTHETPLSTELVESPPIEANIDLTLDNYQVWRDHILPDPSEMAWEQIPWLTTFKDGILAADAANKPLLLWTMNGHPLGCT